MSFVVGQFETGIPLPTPKQEPVFNNPAGDHEWPAWSLQQRFSYVWKDYSSRLTTPGGLMIAGGLLFAGGLLGKAVTKQPAGMIAGAAGAPLAFLLWQSRSNQ